MATTLNFLNQNWVGVLLGVVALFYALYEGNRRRGPRLVYQYLGQKLLGGSVDLLPTGLEVTFSGAAVPRLSLTRLVVWNSGAGPLRGTDIPSHDPLTLKFHGEAKILLAEISRITRDVTKFQIGYEAGISDSVTVNFDFLDPGDGALLSIWHTSTKSIPEFNGTIIGQKDGPVSYGRFIWRGRDVARRGSIFSRTFSMIIDIVFGSPFFLPIMLIAMGTFIAFSTGYEGYTGVRLLSLEKDSDIAKFWTPAILSAVNICAGIWAVNKIRRKFPRKLTPEDFGSPKIEGGN
ncbi:hypothetical protein [Sphingomonas immobilis]|uniref:Uncharacterized protein n=1 Tax=Sphingomonas immobilis TaxID=3063997 RepID=A0ABT8ZVM8_9SPHN|nr:hypothetical protein [Sphingomonas sp. CA1-15]MDO7841632.1 hypothetical protein [Sphingomonas sp. CA1-15]